MRYDKDTLRAHQVKHTIIITLVHGTFARGTGWTKEGSLLRQTLTEALAGPASKVKFDVFEWSGRNTHNARIKAGYELGNHIRKLRKRYPRAQHYIIAHSHGGNIALLAHKHLPNKLHANGIATLGTPFLQATLKEDLQGKSLDQLMEEAPRHTEGVSSLGAWIVGIPTALYADDALSNTDFSAWYWCVGAGIVGGMLAAYLLEWLWPYLARLWHRFSGKRSAVRLANNLRLHKMPETNVVSFTYPGDEAGRLLDILELTTVLPTRVIRIIENYGSLVGGALFTAFLALAFATGLVENFIEFDGDALGSVLGGGLAFLIVGAIALWAHLMVARYVLSLLRGHPWGFGWERPSIHSHVNIVVEPKADLPASKSYVHNEVPFLAVEDGKKRLRHCGLYEDQRILKAIGHWITHGRSPRF